MYQTHYSYRSTSQRGIESYVFARARQAAQTLCCADCAYEASASQDRSECCPKCGAHAWEPGRLNPIAPPINMMLGHDCRRPRNRGWAKRRKAG